jgi:sigma-B regulation protein RsbU (phosphoserine phosphatase)
LNFIEDGMKNRFSLTSIIFTGLSTVMGILTLYCLVTAVTWINKPFAGILLYDFPYVSSVGNTEWPGYKAGLKFLDRIISADGQSIWNGRDLVRVIKDKEPGAPVDYVVEMKGQVQKVTIPVAKFSLKDLFLAFSTLYLCGIAIYVLGVTVYVLKPNTTTSWVFLGLCFCLGSYVVTAFETITFYYLVHFHYLVMSLFPPLFVHLGLIFPERKRLLTRFPRIIYLIYLPAVVLAAAYQIYLFTFEKALASDLFSWVPSYQNIATINRYYTLFCVAGLVVLVFHTMWKAGSGLSRRRAGIILFGLTTAFLPTAIIMLMVITIKINIPWNFLPFFVIFFPAAIAYSIVKHNLFDADVIIKRTVGYFIITAIVVGAYGLLSITFNYFMGQYQIAQSKAFPLLFTLGIILIFNPLRNRVQAVVDRVFFRKEYDYGGIVDKVGGAMTTLLELPQILNRLVQTFMEDMFIDTSSVMLLSSAGVQYQVSLAEGEQKQDVEQVVFKRETPLMDIIESRKRELTKYDILEDPEYKEQSESCVQGFEALHASLMVPLVYQDQVIGSLNLGEKKSGKPYNREDIDLLRNLANQAAIAIENARLFQENLEKQRMEEELNIARDLQMSMLPSECPTIEGLDIAAYSVSAMEVGGDFYDFIDMGENKLGFVIGDVTGKSVSGALVMSASRSVFRMLSEEDLNVSESMIRANRRLKKDVSSGMFVALLYAVVDATKQTLTLCSAGQTQPIQISEKGEEANLVETEGDTFPLGILEEVDYEETRRQLKPGDKVIFYTDGIVEAMNEQEELYGFERLLDVAQGARSMDADSLLKEILAKVDEFVGDAPQHDDLTVIVVGVED